MAQASFYIYFRSDVDTDGLEGKEFTDYKKYIRDHSLHIWCLLGILLCICLPLLFFGQVSYADYITALSEKMAPEGFEPANVIDNESTSADAGFPLGYIAVGLQLKTWAIYGGICGVVGAVLSFIINFIVKLEDAKKGRFGVTEQDVEINKRTIKFFFKYMLILIILLGTTYSASKIFEAKMPGILQTGRQFDNFEDFKQYMEKVPHDMYPGVVEIRQQLDKYKGVVYGDDGELLCEYRKINDSVIDIEFGDDNKLPITVYSEDDQEIAKQKTTELMWIWKAVMIVECMAMVTSCSVKFYKSKKENSIHCNVKK